MKIRSKIKHSFIRDLPILLSGLLIVTLALVFLREKADGTGLFAIIFAVLLLTFLVLYLFITNKHKSIEDRSKAKILRMIKLIFHSLPWSVEIYDKHGYLVWVNAFGSHAWGKHQEAEYGKFNILQTSNLKGSEFVKHLLSAIEGQNSSLNGSDYHLKALGEKNSYKYYETTFAPVYSLQKRVFAVLVINRSIIDGRADFQQKNNYQALNGSNPGETFLRNISHELRTPLNWIIGFSSLLSEEKDLLKIKEYNYHIIKGGKLMLSSIEMLIDMSHIVKNEVTVAKTEFPVNKLLYETAELLREDVQRMEYNLTVKVNSYIQEHEEDRMIISDQKKLRRILNCLINNSLKFTKDGYIELGCANLPEQTLLFYVKDTGIGISEDIKEYIFDAFRKSDSEAEDGLSGHGLGLSIARNYVKLLGGDIWLDSECKKGTTLFFTIKDYSEIKPAQNYKDFVKETALLLFPK